LLQHVLREIRKAIFVVLLFLLFLLLFLLFLLLRSDP
jgi:hypothetical protein|tara:strand:- start:583 stop:693 length:111 start_codon:yes stop_codon:yes gene_type:complete